MKTELGVTKHPHFSQHEDHRFCRVCINKQTKCPICKNSLDKVANKPKTTQVQLISFHLFHYFLGKGLPLISPTCPPYLLKLKFSAQQGCLPSCTGRCSRVSVTHAPRLTPPGSGERRTCARAARLA